MKKRKLTEQEILAWKQCVTDYLEKLYGKPIGELKAALLADGVLRPFLDEKGAKLIRPELAAGMAFYLKKGLAKLYYYDELDMEQIVYVWDAGSIIVIYKSFKEKLPNVEFYISLIEDSELVSISNVTMDGIYKEYAVVAYELTQKILGLKNDRRMLHTRILKMVDKKRRYCEMKKLFPELFINGKCRLNNYNVCSFLGITETTLKDARKICPDKP